MKSRTAASICLLLVACLPGWERAAAVEPVYETNTFVVATYNVRNWLAMTRWGKPDQPKPQGEKMALARYIAGIRPDVLALQEVGTGKDFAEIVGRLRNEGLVYPEGEWIEGWDTNRHVAIVSRFPIVSRNSVIDATYTVGTNTLTMSRGLLDVTIQVNPDYQFRALVVHLKSKRPMPDISQAAMRLEEARILRNHAVDVLKAYPRHNLIAMGDFNDDPDTETLAVVRGQVPPLLFDLTALDQDGRAFTHFWKAQGHRSRLDYLLVNDAMRAELVADSAGIADGKDWETASDHRAVYARFHASERDQPAADAESEPEPAVVAGTSSWPWIAGIAGALVVILVAWRLTPRRPAS